MGKEKKISFKYYVNENVKPLIKNELLHYPLFLRIVFNRQTTSISVNKHYDAGNEFYILKTDFDVQEDSIDKLIGENLSELTLNTELLEKIIRYEYSITKDRHTLKGFGNRLEKIYNEFMSLSIDAVFVCILIPTNNIPKDLYDTLTNLLLVGEDTIGIFKLYSICKLFDKNLNKRMDQHTKDIVISFYLLSLTFSRFENIGKDFRNAITWHEWICTDMKSNFLDIISSKPKIEERINAFEEEKSVISQLIIDIPYSIDQVDTYIRIIDQWINRQIRSV